MYHIVEFENNNVEVVHSSWIEDSDKDGRKVVVAFPPKSMYASIRKFLRSKVAPSSTWSSFTVSVLYSKGK